MTRPEFLRPDVLSTAVVCDVLALAGVKADKAIVGQWSEMEMLLAYDWAMRRHYAASDSLIRQRDKPWIVTVASSSPLARALRQAGGDAPPRILREDVRAILSGAPDGITTKDLLLQLSAFGYEQLDTSVVQEVLEGDDDIGMSLHADPRWLLYAHEAEVSP